MAMVKNLAEAEALLAQHIPAVKAITGKQMTLERMMPLMQALGNPHENLKIIHIAGTSGKTSTSYYIASLLSAAGKKVGLTVSPHIDIVTERIQINMQPLSEGEFVAALNEYIDIINKTDLHPTYFELLVSMAYWYFDKCGVDYAVVETGLGGMYDGTNIAQNADKVCVITDIGLDHMHILGNTVQQIALQKAGIIHSQNQVFAQSQPAEIMAIIQKYCDDIGARLYQVNNIDLAVFGDLPDFQKRNAHLAYEVFEYIAKTDGLSVVDVSILGGVQVPGRMTEVKIGQKTIIMDGAHNEQKMQAFISSFQSKYPGKKVPILFALKQGKELLTVLPLLKRITDTIIITEYEWMQDLPIPALNAEELGIAAQKLGLQFVRVERDMTKAYEEFMSKVQNIGVITGSFYLIAQLRQYFEELRV